VGVSISPPKEPSCAKPVSSSSTTSTFGEPAAGLGSSGHHGSDSKW
jgi:hypothetical protein